MNYLQLVQTVYQEAGLAGGGPSSLASADAISRKIARWVQEAWVELQAVRPWPFNLRHLTFNLTIGQQNYTLADLGGPSVDRWDQRFARIVGGHLTWIDYDDHRERQAYQVTAINAMPHTVAADGLNGLMFACAPDDDYRVSLDYWQEPQVLTLATDTPAIPEHFQRAILHGAIMRYAVHDGASELYGPADAQYKQIYRRMIDHYFPVGRATGAALA